MVFGIRAASGNFLPKNLYVKEGAALADRSVTMVDR
jgi:hypothetical protein